MFLNFMSGIKRKKTTENLLFVRVLRFINGKIIKLYLYALFPFGRKVVNTMQIGRIWFGVIRRVKHSMFALIRSEPLIAVVRSCKITKELTKRKSGDQTSV